VHYRLSRQDSQKKTTSGIPLITAKIIKGGRLLDVEEYIAESDYTAWMRRGLPLVGDVLITTEAPLGEIAQLSHRRVALAQRVILLRGQSNLLDNTFLRFALQWSGVQAQLRARMSGTTVTGIKQSELRKVSLPVPPLAEQRRIAALLSALDDKNELNDQLNRTLEEMAQTLFKSWFIDFDGHTDLVDSVLGSIPRGWRCGTLLELAELNPESWSTRNRPDQIRYVDLSNTKWGRIDTVTEYRGDDAPSRAQRVLRRGDTIVGTVRPGNGSYALIPDEGLTGSTGFAVLRPRAPEYVAYLYFAATRRENIDRLAHLADGGAYPAVRPEVVAQTPVVLPALDWLRRYGKIVDPLIQRIEYNRQQSRTLTVLRDILLPKLISGQLKVPESLDLVFNAHSTEVTL
jgi:type I restriction enzyme S subunit